MIEQLSQRWPWYISGPLIGLIVPALLLLGSRQFGVSANLRHLCAALVPGRPKFLQYDWWKTGSWNLAFALGIVVGGWIAPVCSEPRTPRRRRFPGWLRRPIRRWLYLRARHLRAGRLATSLPHRGSCLLRRRVARDPRCSSLGSAMSPEQRKSSRPVDLVPYLLIGVLFGITATQSQVVSWYRIQEMFRFHSFHMYGVILSAVAVATLGILAIRRGRARDLVGATIEIPAKNLGHGYRYWIGGTLFGLGWGLTGACPGPIFALIGNGVPGALVLLLSALIGTWAYAVLRPHLPH